MKIAELDLAGFKSFADQAKMIIEPGMTGIVGPNGCGKSNLLEALGWAMGETSAKSMRAEDMDSVIFGGTDVRPAKPSAKVTVTIDNADRLAPVEFNDADVLRVSRRIDRGEGSSYEVNGKPARARDIRTLYKDAGIGSGSSALVSQGKVAAIISAKPENRKKILEEAAGVTGLTSRRHEADLRLRATEQNLDQSVTLGKELSDMQASLKRQARQAKFKLEIDTMIRAAEALSFLVRFRSAVTKEGSSSTAHVANEEIIKELLIDLSRRQGELSDLEAAVAPALKARSDAEMAHAMANARVEAVRKQAETDRKALLAVEKNISRVNADILRDRTEITNSVEEHLLLKDEVAIALDDKNYDATLIEEAVVDMEMAKDALDDLSSGLADQSNRFAALRVEWTSAQKAVDDLLRRLEATRTRLAASVERSRQMRSELSGLPEPAEEVADLEQSLEQVFKRLQERNAARDAASLELVSVNGEHSGLQAERGVLVSEEKALRSARSANGGLQDVVRALPGFEEALAAALGDNLDARLGISAGKHFVLTDVRATVPSNIKPLVDIVTVPEELSAALSGVGYVPEESVAETASLSLQPGQAIVTRSGRLYRWDGFRSSANEAAAAEIRRGARLKALGDLLGDVDIRIGETARRLANVKETVAETSVAATLAKQTLDRTKSDLDQLRKALEETEARRAGLLARLATAGETEEMLAAQIEEELVTVALAEEGLTALPDLVIADQELGQTRLAVGNATKVYEDHRFKVEKVRRDADLRAARIVTIQQKMADFDRRMVEIRAHIVELDERLKEFSVEEQELKDSLDLHPEREAVALDDLEDMAAQMVEAAKIAQQSDIQLERVRGEYKAVEEKVMSRREDRARLLAEIKAAKDATGELEREIEDRLQVRPEGLLLLSGVGADDELPDLSTCDSRVQGLLRRRETVGTVNLLAEEQLQEVEDKLGRSNAQREELREAVRRLREMIDEFDRERRERLIEAFAHIDGHFRELFTRLFGGGRAFLKLSGSDDPLLAGLEIFASPPGKNLQTMSLLSGGEQALTALALIFAAFLTRPAPVCVLDEVDAALDDANVERLCRMVSGLAGTETRFLVITHRAMTMTKCDRLYGVTMAERGVSRLMSLDMSQAASFVRNQQHP